MRIFPYCFLYISYGTSEENLSMYHDISSLVITSFILITWMFEQVVVMFREISFSSLLGLQGLMLQTEHFGEPFSCKSSDTEFLCTKW